MFNGLLFFAKNSIVYLCELLMKRISEILGGLWVIYFALILSTTLILLYPFYALFLSQRRTYKYAFGLLKAHTLFVLTLNGVFVSVKDKHYLKNIGPCVITPNHTSYLDILILYRVMPHYFIFMGKHTLKTIPVFNIFFKDMNVAVDRKSGMSGKQALERCGLELDKGNSVTLFPEGTIPEDVPNMLPFKVGAFKLAIEKQLPIVPITFLSNYKRMQLGSLFKAKAGPGLAKVVAHEPIQTRGMSSEDLVPLQDKVYHLINQELEAHGCR